MEAVMSRYAINTLLYNLKKDTALRARFIKDPRAAIADADLTDGERAAFIAGDMKKINELGGYLHLVMSVPKIGTHGRH
jgi:hypothetical protein